MTRPLETGTALGVVLLALAWQSAEHLAAPPDQAQALVLAVAGLLALGWSWKAAAAPKGPATGCLRWFDLAAISTLAVWLTAASGRPSCYLYGVGAACLLGAAAPLVRRSGFGGPLALGGLVLTLSGASTVLLRGLAWGLHEVPLPGLAAGLKVWTGERLAVLGLTFEGLGLYVIWYLLVGLAIVAALSPPDRGWKGSVRALACGAALVAAYGVARFAFTAVLAIEFDHPALLWSSRYTALSWLPLALILRCPGRPPRPGRTASATPRAAVAAASAGLCLAFALAYNDPGLVKPGRVLFDEGHADWEWTEAPFDTTAFGIRAEYNYYCFREFLGHFYDVSTTTAEMLPDALDGADVLVVKTPTRPYSDREVESIVGFVRRGGGLLLIGDHTNLFGMTTYLNAIAGRFGMRFRGDDTFDLASTGFSTYLTARPAPHPALRAVGRLEFLTSCTIAAGPACEAVIVGYGLGSEDGDYGHPNFFGNISFDLCDRFGLFLQAAARRFGDGRVFLFTDSTCLSNFCLFSAGKPEAALGAIDYLNRHGERLPHARAAFLLLAGAPGLVAWSGVSWLPGTGPGRRARGLWLPAAIGLFLGIPLAAGLGARAYGPVDPERPPARILFDTQHSGVSFFDWMGVSPVPASQHFEEFYLCSQRLGFHPAPGPAADLETVKPAHRPAAFVIVNPDQPFAGADIGRVFDYVRGGGVLLVLDGVTNAKSTAGEILRHAGMEIRVVPEAVSGGLGDRRWVVPALRAFSWASEGAGDPNAADRADVPAGAGAPCVTIAEVGSGRVVLVTDSFRYSAAVLGFPLDRRPAPAGRREIYREAFALYRRALAIPTLGKVGG